MKNQSNKKPFDRYVFKALTQKKTFPWVKDLTCDWLVIAGSIAAALSWNNPLGYALLVFVLGNRQHALAILGHDGTHFTLSRSKRFNDTVTNLFTFWPLGLTTSGYRNLHFAHHRHTNTDQDPELMHRSSKAPQWDLPVTVRKVLRYAAMDMVGYSLSDYLMIVAFARPDHKRSYIALGLFHIAFIGISLLLGAWWLPLMWYGSLMTSFMMFFRLRTWLEHQGTDDTHRLHLNRLERILSPHNAWYHYEHHHWPAVPYYRLPELRQLIKDPPVISLKELMRRYKEAAKVRSGQPLKIQKNKKHEPAETRPEPHSLAA